MSFKVITVGVLISSLSFLAYAIPYFKTPYMKNEFKRFGLEKFAFTIIILEILGALGLLVGLKFKIMLSMSSLGLALLMLAGVIVRIIVKEQFKGYFTSSFFALLNAYIFWFSFNKVFLKNNYLFEPH